MAVTDHGGTRRALREAAGAGSGQGRWHARGLTAAGTPRRVYVH